MNFLMSLMTTSVFLAGGRPDAVNDIINNPMFAGSLESLSKVIQVVDSWFGFVISLCGFFIMASALLKNAIAGVYASNPKLFDKVNEVKNNLVTTADGYVKSANNRGIRGVGTVGVFILRLLPDPKEFSDFRDDTITPRDYFIKAIPQMIGVAMIGIVIWDGYYRDVLAKTANVGCAIVEKFLLDVDPVEGLYKALGWASRPDLASAQDDSVSGKVTNKISYEMYHSIVSFYTDQSALNARNSIANSVESWASNQVVSNCQAYLDDSKWKYSVKVTRVLNEPNLSNINKTGEEQVVQAWAFPISSLALDTSKHKGEDWWLRVIVVWDRVRETTKTTSKGVVTDGTLVIPNANVADATSSGVHKVVIRMEEEEANYFSLGSTAKVNNTYSITKVNNGFIINGVTLAELNLDSGVTISGLYYKSGDNTATIRSLKKDSAKKFTITSSKGTVDVGNSFNLTETTTSSKK